VHHGGDVSQVLNIEGYPALGKAQPDIEGQEALRLKIAKGAGGLGRQAGEVAVELELRLILT
jgi:hypothetical protein